MAKRRIVNIFQKGDGMTLSERLSEYVQACFTGIWIESHEHEDAIQESSSRQASRIAPLC